MKLKIRYENEFQELELDAEAIETLWVCLSPGDTYTIDQKENEIQESWNIKFNRPEYNVHHRQERHRGYVISTRDEFGDETGNFEPSMEEVKDNTIFLRDSIDQENAAIYEAVKQFVYSVLKEDIADLFMAIRIDGFSINELAESMLSIDAFETEDDYKKAVERLANSITQKLKRANEKLKNNFNKASDFGLGSGYQVGSKNTSDKL